MAHFTIASLSRELQRIAQSDGGQLPHALEGEEAILKAAQLLETWLAHHPQAKPNAYYWESVKSGLAILQQHHGETPLQVNPIFKLSDQDHFPTNLQWANKEALNVEHPTFELFTELPSNIFVGIDVYYTDARGWWGFRRRVTALLTEKLWREIVSPLISDVTSTDSEESELEAVLQATRRFEEAVGPIAGTSLDRGGWKGNKYILSPKHPIEDHQQKCNDEFVTAAAFFHLLSVHHLLFHLTFDPMDPAVVLSDHGAPKMKKLNGASIVIDTWIRNNGEKPMAFKYPQEAEAWIRAVHETR